jgi:hypothetical protein
MDWVSPHPWPHMKHVGEGFTRDLLERLKKPNDQRADSEIVRAIAQHIADLIPKMHAPS